MERGNGVIRKRGIILFGALLIFLALWVFGYLLLTKKNHEGKVGVTISTVPSDATTTIDGKGFKNGTFYFEPGLHEVKVSKEGFATYSSTPYFDETKRLVVVILQAESTEAKEWVKNNQSKQYGAQVLAQRDTIASGEAITKKNPIITKLPYKTFQYSIGYTVDSTDPSGKSIIVTIYANESYRQSAINRIRQFGFDPTDLNILFKDYENPFPL